MTFDTRDKFLFPIRFFSIDTRNLAVGVTVLETYDRERGLTLDFSYASGLFGGSLWRREGQRGYESESTYQTVFVKKVFRNTLYMARSYKGDLSGYFYRMEIPPNPAVAAVKMTQKERENLVVRLSPQINSEIVAFNLKKSRGRTLLLAVAWGNRNDIYEKFYRFKVFQIEGSGETPEIKELESQNSPGEYMGRWGRKFYFLGTKTFRQNSGFITYGDLPVSDDPLVPQMVTQFRYLKGKIVSKTLNLEVPNNLELEEFYDFEGKQKMTVEALKNQLSEKRYTPDVENGWIFFYQQNSMYSLVLRKFFKIPPGGVNPKTWRNMLGVAALDSTTIVTRTGVYSLRDLEFVRVQELKGAEYNYSTFEDVHTLFRGPGFGLDLYGKVRDKFELLSDASVPLGSLVPIPTLADDRNRLVKFLEDNVPLVARELLGIVVDFCKWY